MVARKEGLAAVEMMLETSLGDINPLNLKLDSNMTSTQTYSNGAVKGSSVPSVRSHYEVSSLVQNNFLLRPRLHHSLRF